MLYVFLCVFVVLVVLDWPLEATGHSPLSPKETMGNHMKERYNFLLNTKNTYVGTSR